MPTLQRFGAVKVCMYADDSPTAALSRRGYDFGVLVRISDLEVIAGEARPAQIAEAIAWARDHREHLALKWVELNKRG